jgi:hypothetical protein
MPTWKKVIVSGSAAELSQLNVGANQQITTAQGTTFLTGSFTGSFTGNGAGLTGVTATAIFPTTAKTDLATTDQIYINDGANKYVTYGNLVTDLAGSGAGTSNLTTTDTGDSLALTSQIAVTGVTASFLGNVAGTASWATNVVNNGVTSVATAGTVSGITLTGGTITSTGTITLGGSISGLTNSNLSGTAGITNANLANSAITIAGTSTSLGGSITAATILSGTGVFSGSAQITGLTNSNLSGTAGITNANLANSSVTVGSTAISLGSSATTIAGLTSVTSTGFTGSLQGTASWANNATTATTANATTAALTAGAGLLSGGTFNGSTARTFSVDSGSMLAYYSGSIFSTLSGGATVSQNGVVTLKTGLVSGSSITSGAQGEVTLTTNGVAASAVDLGLQTSDSPTFAGATLTGNLAINNGTSTAITTTGTTAALFNANATTVNIAGAATTLNLGNASGTTTIAGNGIVQGDFTVNGTVTYLNVQDLYVEDRFIVLASGSATAGDGGIMVDRGSDAAGNIAYGFDSVTDRWGFQSGLADSTNTFDPTSASGVSGSFVPYLFTEANHGATKPITGEFAVVGSQYMDAAGNFWVYTV